MFPWSSVFSAAMAVTEGEDQVPERSSEELVTRMLMLELNTLLKHAEKQHEERATAERRRSSCVDYSWLATPRRCSYQLPTREFLELEELCAKIPPSQCGPVILRMRNLVIECEPGVGEVSRLFRSVLCACLDEEEQRRAGREGPSLTERTQHWRRRRSRSLSLISLPSSVRVHPLWSPSRPKPDAASLRTEEEEGGGGGGGGLTVASRSLRARSLPQINVVEDTASN